MSEDCVISRTNILMFSLKEELKGKSFIYSFFLYQTL